MNTAHMLRYFVVRLLPLLGLLSAHAIAQNDPPGRVGRLNHAEGVVTFSPAGDNEWIDAELNRPLTRGDRLWTDKGARAEIQIGSSAVRMDGRTQLEILALDDQSAQLSVTQGTVYVRVRSLPEGENFEIDTPNLAYRAAYPGDYRIDVDAARGSTRVTIHSGTGAVYGEGGQALPLGGGQQITFRGRGLTQLAAQESPPQDNFDRWAAERNRREDQSVSARYVPREVVGYQQLDAHGQWQQDATHGPVWYPQGTAANWAPYRHGRWEWIAPWGWTWIDDSSWGFAPFHYGRWAMIGSRWAWVPGRIGLRPVYAPALVAFIGGGSGGVNWNISIGSGRPGVAWFPLGPGESWQPGYRASPVYISNVNRNMTLTNASYVHQRRPEALTAILAEDFHRGRPVRGSWLRVAGNVLTSAQVVPPPPMPERSGIVGRDRTAVARAAPPQTEIRQVTASAPAAPQQPQQQAEAQRQAAEQAKAAQQARAAEQTKAAEQAKLAEQARLAEQTKAAEQAKAVQQAKAAEQAKATEQAKAAEQAKALQQAKLAEQAKAAQQTKAAEQAKAAEQSKAAQQAKLAEQARAAQQERLAQQTRAAEQARLAQAAAAAKLAQQPKATPKVAQAKPEPTAKLAEQSKREQQAKRAEASKREQMAKLEQAKLEQARRDQAAKRERDQLLAKRAEQSRKGAQQAKREEQARRQAHAQQVELARRAAERDAQALREQRALREEQARRVALEREQVQRDAWQRQQQAISEQWRRDHQAWEEQQRERTRQRPDLRNDRRVPPQPEVWQRGVPILNPGRTS